VSAIERLLRRLPKLGFLNLRRTPVTNALSAVGTGPLRTLCLRDCKRITALELTRSGCLTDLNASFNPLLQIVTLVAPELTTLNLSKCKLLKSVTVTAPALRSLNLSGCAALQTLAITTPTKLTSVNIFQCGLLDGATILAVARSGASTIEDVVACGCRGFSEEEALRMAEECRRLRRVELGRASNRTVRALLEDCLRTRQAVR
jgi:hypothetical protein